MSLSKRHNRQRKEMEFSKQHHSMMVHEPNPYLANVKKLKSCKSHNFTIHVNGGSMKCENCGGILSAGNVAYYELGRLHEYHDNLEKNMLSSNTDVGSTDGIQDGLQSID